MYDWSLFLKLIVSIVITLDHQGHTDVIIHQPSLFLRYQMNFTNKPINPCTLIALNLKERTKERQINEFMLPLEVLALIPLNHRVLQLTHPISITEDLKHPVSNRPRFAIIAISKYIIHRRLSQ